MEQKRILILVFIVFIISTYVCWSIQLIKSVRTLAFIKYASISALSIADIELFASWGRNPETDLPRHFCSLNFEIQSSIEGTGVLTVVIGRASNSREFMLESGITSVGGFAIISDYDDFGRTYFLKTYLAARTSSVFLYTYKVFFWSSPELPRYLDERVARLYITPRNPSTGI